MEIYRENLKFVNYLLLILHNSGNNDYLCTIISYMNSNDHTEIFYQFLRLSLGQTQEFIVDADQETWQQMFKTAVRQSLVGVCYQGISLLPDEKRPPMGMIMKWAFKAETISGRNGLQNREAARLTQLFAEKGRRTAILKGQANARLYPNKLSRQTGDIDIWVEGGRDSVLALLMETGLIDGQGKTYKEGHHQVRLTENEKGVIVEVHFGPPSDVYNPFANKRLHRWLEAEIMHTERVEEGFIVPSLRFALVMQLSHIHHHFMGEGIGLRQVCDYFMLLGHSSAEDRQVVAECLKSFGLQHTAAALMWVLGKVLHLDPALMLCQPDSSRGEWMLHDSMSGGNFGQFSQRQSQGLWQKFFSRLSRRLRMLSFAPSEVSFSILHYLQGVIERRIEKIHK